VTRAQDRKASCQRDAGACPRLIKHVRRTKCTRRSKRLQRGKAEGDGTKHETGEGGVLRLDFVGWISVLVGVGALVIAIFAWLTSRKSVCACLL
jgi:hypothetical protein